MNNMFGVSFDTYKRLDGKVLFKPSNSKIWLSENEFEGYATREIKSIFSIDYWANRNPYSIDGLLINEAPTTVEIETEIAQFLY